MRWKPFSSLPGPVQAMLLLPLMLVGSAVGLLAILFLPSFGVTNPVAFLESTQAQANNVPATLFLLAFAASIGQFFIPALLLQALSETPSFKSLKLNIKPSLLFLLIGIGAMFFGSITQVFLSEVNKMIHLPESFNWLQRNDLVELSEKLMAYAITPGRLIIMTICMAIIPAICEEFFFRGVMQRKLSQTGAGPEAAIFVTAIIFSLIHMDFSNFFARMLMGVVLGYLYYWSGSLWVSIFAHFFNNFMVLLIAYLTNIGVFGTDINKIDTVPWYITIPAFVMLSAFMYLGYKFKNTEHPIYDLEEDNHPTQE